METTLARGRLIGPDSEEDFLGLFDLLMGRAPRINGIPDTSRLALTPGCPQPVDDLLLHGQLWTALFQAAEDDGPAVPGVTVHVVTNRLLDGSPFSPTRVFACQAEGAIELSGDTGPLMWCLGVQRFVQMHHLLWAARDLVPVRVPFPCGG